MSESTSAKRIYRICDCCDTIYSVTDLTANMAEGIMDQEPEIGNDVYVTGICDDCRSEMYGSVGGLIQPYRLH
ncbi:MAG: hypothetical protein FWC60_10950 [Firmicutes bacterium]|nr:hypothetical protein [Bacillota bacterium]